MSDINQKFKISLFLASQAITLFGSSVVQFALVWFVTLRTSSGFWVSMLSVCAYLPQFIISLFAGTWADRHSRKLLIIVSDASIAAVTLVMAILLPFVKDDTMLLSVIMVVSAVRSVGTGIQTPAVNAVIPQLVSGEQLMRINGINSTIQSVVQFAAPAAAGAILNVSTLSVTLMIDIATAVAGISILSFVFIPKTERCEGKINESVFDDLKSGVKYVFADKFLAKLMLLYGVFIFLCVPSGFLATLFVSRTYGYSYFYLTVVELVGFVGMMVGGLLIGVWGGFRNRMKTMLGGLFAFGLLAVGMGAVKNFILYLAFMLVYGIAFTMVQTASTTLIQEKVSVDMQGRVFGFLGVVYSGFLPIGMAVFGPMSDTVPLNIIMIVSGSVLILASFIVYMDRKFFLHGIKQP